MYKLRYLLIIAVAAACSSEEQAYVHSFRIYEENGVTIAETTGGPKYTELLFEFEQVMEIRTPESNKEALLAFPHDFMRNEAGNYFIVDGIRSDPRIVVYNHDGQYIRTIGRIGDGPGEFRRPVLQNIRSNVLEVFDEQLLRTSRFDINGDLISVMSLVNRLPRVEALYRGDQEKLIIIQYQMETVGHDLWMTRICTIQSPGGTSDVVLETPRVKEMTGVVTSYAPDGTPLYGRMEIQFNGAPNITSPTGSEVIISTGEDPILQWYDLSGRLVREVRVNISPQTVSNNERREIIRSAKQGPMSKTEVKVNWNALVEFKNPKAFWESVDVDNYGYIWLEYPRSIINQVSATHRLLSPEGEYLGDVQFPVTGGKPQYGKYLVLVRNRETDEESPTVFHMSPKVEGFKYPQ